MGDLPVEEAPVEHFDLSESSAAAIAFRSDWRFFGGLIVALGIFMVVAGAALLAVHAAAWGVSYSIAVGVFVLGGAIVAAASWPLARQARSYPTALVVSRRELIVKFRSQPDPIVWPWMSPRFRLGLIDRKGLPPKHPDGSLRPRYAFQVAEKGPWIPIPGQAFDSLLKQAEANGLGIVRHETRSPRVPGTYVKISIRAARRVPAIRRGS